MSDPCRIIIFANLKKVEKMGTRNLTNVVYEGETIVSQYGQWDGYPEGQGTTMFYTLQEDGTIEKFINNIPRIYYPTETELDALFKAYEDGSMPGMMTVDSGEKWAKAFPTLTRNTCAEIFRVIANWDGSPKIPVRLDKDFEDDALYCEAVYVVDLDNKTFTSKWGRGWDKSKPNYGEWEFVVTLTFDEVKAMKVEDYHARFKQEALV
jgi:hypothetical protein